MQREILMRLTHRRAARARPVLAISTSGSRGSVKGALSTRAALTSKHRYYEPSGVSCTD
jgi:hypothetical protein